MHVVLGYSVRSHSPASIAARRISNTYIDFPLGLVTFYFGKNPTFHAKTLRSGHMARPAQIARSVRSAAAPTRPMGAAACVYNAHIESPSDTPSLPVSHQCAAPSANHRSLYGCRPTAIAARGISAIEIDFALGIVAPGGLTSGFALPI